MKDWDNGAEFHELTGKTLIAVEGLERGNDAVTFRCSDGSVYVQYHSQDCCESVDVEEIVGDIADIVGSPIVKAEEVEGATEPDDWKPDYTPESYTWTFYKIDTIKGGITIRWLGTSNGYYSESVHFKRTSPPKSGAGQ